MHLTHFGSVCHIASYVCALSQVLSAAPVRFGSAADTFIQKTKKLFLDTRSQRNVAALTADLTEVHNIMSRNIAEVLGQGEKLDSEWQDGGGAGCGWVDGGSMCASQQVGVHAVVQLCNWLYRHSTAAQQDDAAVAGWRAALGGLLCAESGNWRPMHQQRLQVCLVLQNLLCCAAGMTKLSSTLAAESKSYAKRAKDLHTQVCSNACHCFRQGALHSKVHENSVKQ